MIVKHRKVTKRISNLRLMNLGQYPMNEIWNYKGFNLFRFSKTQIILKHKYWQLALTSYLDIIIDMTISLMWYIHMIIDMWSWYYHWYVILLIKSGKKNLEKERILFNGKKA
jgi:hypothetical protein